MYFHLDPSYLEPIPNICILLHTSCNFQVFLTVRPTFINLIFLSLFSLKIVRKHLLKKNKNKNSKQKGNVSINYKVVCLNTKKPTFLIMRCNLQGTNIKSIVKILGMLNQQSKYDSQVEFSIRLLKLGLFVLHYLEKALKTNLIES